MVTIELDQETQEYLDRRKQLLLTQAKILCDAYDAGTLKKALAALKGNTSDSQQPRPLAAAERSER